MLKLIPALSLLGAFAVPAFAGPCVALDYQEMKDMSTDELAKEYCKISDAWMANMDDITANLGVSRGPKPFPNAQDNFDQCYGQVQRVERVLASKGVSKDAMKTICTRVKAGQPITTPAEAK